MYDWLWNILLDDTIKYDQLILTRGSLPNARCNIVDDCTLKKSCKGF